MTGQKKEYKWLLIWHGSKDTPMLRAAAKACETFPLWKDSKARLINFATYQKLLIAKEISPAVSYWQIEPGQIGMISLKYYSQYSNTWNLISTCKSDFEDGWLACEKHFKFLINRSKGLTKLF